MEVRKHRLRHIFHDVMLGIIVTVFTLPLQIFMGLSRLQRQAEILVCACRPLMYKVQTAWNDIADGNIMVKHNEFLLCESFILFFFQHINTLWFGDKRVTAVVVNWGLTARLSHSGPNKLIPFDLRCSVTKEPPQPWTQPLSKSLKKPEVTSSQSCRDLAGMFQMMWDF